MVRVIQATLLTEKPRVSDDSKIFSNEIKNPTPIAVKFSVDICVHVRKSGQNLWSTLKFFLCDVLTSDCQ